MKSNIDPKVIPDLVRAAQLASGTEQMSADFWADVERHLAEKEKAASMVKPRPGLTAPPKHRTV